MLIDYDFYWEFIILKSVKQCGNCEEIAGNLINLWLHKHKDKFEEKIHFLISTSLYMKYSLGFSLHDYQILFFDSCERQKPNDWKWCDPSFSCYNKYEVKPTSITKILKSYSSISTIIYIQ